MADDPALSPRQAVSKINQNGWLSSATSCLFGGSEEVVGDRLTRHHFVKLQGIHNLLVVGDIKTAIDSWKANIVDQLYVVQATYGADDPLVKEVQKTLPTDLYRGHKLESPSAKLDYTGERILEENDLNKENTHLTSIYTSFIQSMLDKNFKEAMRLNDSILSDESASTVNPLGRATSLHNKGMLYLLNLNFKKAIFYFYESVQAKNSILGKEKVSAISTGETIEQCAVALLAYDKGERAIKLFHEIQKMKPSEELFLRSWNGLGCCFAKKGELQLAMDCFEKAQSKSTTNGYVALGNLGCCRIISGEMLSGTQNVVDVVNYLVRELGSNDEIVKMFRNSI